MTAEIALMNKNAVALAADSASTVTYWEGGKPIERYFKNANKIFNISEQDPVGLMIYQSSALQGMPWEVIAKSYRDARSNKSFNKLKGYVSDFFDFLIKDAHLFPASQQADHLVSAVAQAVLRVSTFILNEIDEKDPEEKTSPIIKERFDVLKTTLNEQDLISNLDKDLVRTETQKVKAKVEELVSDFPRHKRLIKVIAWDDVFALGALFVFNVRWTTLQYTGVVFAGYGTTEYFPQLDHYRCFGVLLGRLICQQEKDMPVAISNKISSAIEPFAQADMVRTFMYGASIEALRHFDSSVTRSLDTFSDELVKAKHLDGGVNIDDLKKKSAEQFSDEVTSYMVSEHSRPLRNVVGMLAVNELAELAETLISIESLKERVTRPTESVGGAIDVAIISKSDGFIWIKRKHYFEPELNPRYFNRRGTGTRPKSGGKRKNQNAG